MVRAELVALEQIERVILVLRGYGVLLDEDLAALYGVDVKVLNQAVKRNSERFPEDFMFQLDKTETAFLRSQIVTLNASGRGRHRKYAPFKIVFDAIRELMEPVPRPSRRIGFDAGSK